MLRLMRIRRIRVNKKAHDLSIKAKKLVVPVTLRVRYDKQEYMAFVVVSGYQILVRMPFIMHMPSYQFLTSHSAENRSFNIWYIFFLTELVHTSDKIIALRAVFFFPFGNIHL